MPSTKPPTTGPTTGNTTGNTTGTTTGTTTRHITRRMAQRLATVALALHLLAEPVKAWAQEAARSPLSYTLKDYGLVISTALLGGLVGWYAKVRRGEIAALSLVTLIGELCTSAFAGLLAFWLCEWAGLAPLFTAAIVGISGHAGTTAIARLEKLAEQRMAMHMALSSPPGNTPADPATTPASTAADAPSPTSQAPNA